MRWVGILSLILMLLAPSWSMADDATPAQDPAYFSNTIAPLLRTHCQACHNDQDTEGGLDLSSYAGLLQGGDSGPSITPGAVASSRLYLMVAGQMEPAMPPDPDDRLDEAQLQQLADWIQAGAAGPSDQRPATPQLHVSSIRPQHQLPPPLSALALSPDGQTLALAQSGRVELLSLASLPQDVDALVPSQLPADTRLTIHDFPGKVTRLQFSPDGRQLLVASGIAGLSGQAYSLSLDPVWPLPTTDGAPEAEDGLDQAPRSVPLTELALHQWGDHRDLLYAVAMSPDGRWIATAGYDRQIQLWDAISGDAIRTLTGHNGAVFDLVFTPDSGQLISVSADETVKLWQVPSGQRVATLGQPEGEVHALAFWPGNPAGAAAILAVGADLRLRVWNWDHQASDPSFPLVETRFIDDSPLVALALSHDQQLLAIASQSGNLTLVATGTWDTLAILKPVPGTPSHLTFSLDDRSLWLAGLDGKLHRRSLPADLGAKIADAARRSEPTDHSQRPAPLPAAAAENQLLAAGSGLSQLPQPHLPAVFLTPTEAETWEEPADAASQPDRPLAVPRGVIIRGRIGQPGESDYFQWEAKQGEMWAIDADPVVLGVGNGAGDGGADGTRSVPATVGLNGSQSEGARGAGADGTRSVPATGHPSLTAQGDVGVMDPHIAILDQRGEAVRRVRLQGIRETYFTFRGKDSFQSDDFRLFGWQEMRLDDFLYASGEVTRLWMHPRGPDSGFDVYPGGGQRWTYFGSSHVVHALGEPAYIVRPLAHGQEPLPNGLPVFDLYYENDDDPRRRAGQGSRLLFQAPADGRYTVAITDTRGQGGSDYHYQLRIRPAQPDFQASTSQINHGLLVGAGREFTVTVQRFDDFDGPVHFEINGLPPGVQATHPVVVEAGQHSAQGTVWIAEDRPWPETVEPKVTATAQVLGIEVQRPAGTLGSLKKADAAAPLIPWIADLSPATAGPEAAEVSVSQQDAADDEKSLGPPAAFEKTLTLRPGQTLRAEVRVRRGEGQSGEISFGNALAGRNTPHGVYVDNIGLNGLLLLAGMEQREFFLTADPKTPATRRPFFLKAEIDGGITTLPVWLDTRQPTGEDTETEDRRNRR